MGIRGPMGHGAEMIPSPKVMPVLLERLTLRSSIGEETDRVSFGWKKFMVRGRSLFQIIKFSAFPKDTLAGVAVSFSHIIHGTGIFTYIYHKNQPFMYSRLIYQSHGLYGFVFDSIFV